MLYEMRCDVCKRELEIGCSINMHDDIIKPGILCTKWDKLWPPRSGYCKGTLRQVFKPSSMIIERSPFPATGNEVQLPTPHHVDMKFQDKIHARDWLGERGLTSKWIENDM